MPLPVYMHRQPANPPTNHAPTNHRAACLLPAYLPLPPPPRFDEAIKAGRISAVDALRDCCVLAAVGQKMASRRGMAATMFAALAKANINIRAIAQGSSEFNITTLIDQKDSGGWVRRVGGWVLRVGAAGGAGGWREDGSGCVRPLVYI